MISSNIEESKIISENTYLSYLPTLKSALIDHTNGANLFSCSPPYFGLINPDSVASSYSYVNMKDGSFNGHMVVIYELCKIHAPKKKLYIYADPSIGYRYLRLEYYLGNFQSQVVTAQDYRNSNGVIFPFKHTNIVYASQAKDVSIESIKEIVEVKSAQFGLKINPDTFKISFPQGTTVNDRKIGHMMKIGELDESLKLPEDISNMVATAKLEAIQSDKSSLENSATPVAKANESPKSITNVADVQPVKLIKRKNWPLIMLCSVIGLITLSLYIKRR
jgi:hypothetical protein